MIFQLFFLTVVWKKEGVEGERGGKMALIFKSEKVPNLRQFKGTVIFKNLLSVCPLGGWFFLSDIFMKTIYLGFS